MLWLQMASHWRGRAISTSVGILLIGVMTFAVTTDLQAHARGRHERTQLTAARRDLSANRFDLAATTYDKALTANRRTALQASVATTLGQLATTEQSLSANDADLLFQGVSLGTLEDCLGGVQSSYQQIAAHNNTLAAEDISASSSACLTLAGGSSSGLVYPFDFPDPDVLVVGSTYYAYATNSVAGNIQIIESTNLTTWNPVGNALPSLPGWATPDATWAPAVAHIGADYSSLLRGRSGGSGRRGGVHLGGYRRSTAGAVRRQLIGPAGLPTLLGGIARPVPLHGHHRRYLSDLEVERGDGTGHHLVRAARPGRHGLPAHWDAIEAPRAESSMGSGSG